MVRPWQRGTPPATSACGTPGPERYHLVPHKAVRRLARGNANRPPSGAERQKMETLIDCGMRETWQQAAGSKTEEVWPQMNTD